MPINALEHFERAAKCGAAAIVACSLTLPANAIEARQAFAFMVAAFERTADQCNYADSVRQSMARLDVQNAIGDVAGWDELKARGSSALDNLDGIMPLNMDWTSCSSVGGLLADWATIAAVSQAMDGAAIPAPADNAEPTEARGDELLSSIINGTDDAQPYTLGRWQVTPLENHLQGGCVMTSMLNPHARLVALARPGDILQLGIVTSDGALLNVVATDLTVSVDKRRITVATPQTDHRSIVWFDGQRTDQFGIAADFASAEWLEITLNGKTLTRQLKDFAAASAELTNCAERSLQHVSADWLMN